MSCRSVFGALAEGNHRERSFNGMIYNKAGSHNDDLLPIGVRFDSLIRESSRVTGKDSLAFDDGIECRRVSRRGCALKSVG